MKFSLKPVWGDNLIGREEELDEIVTTILRNRTGFAIYGVRRVGKTSILLEVRNRLKKEKNIKVFYLSLWGLLPSTLENFLLEFLIKLLDIYLVDVRIKFKEIIKLDSASIRSNIDVLSLSPELKEKIVDLLCVWKNKEINCYNLAKDIFKLPQQLATESSSVSVLLLDEFPAILDYEDGASIVGCIRTLNEKQDSVVYLIAGSERKTMKQVVLDSMSPFYKQLIPKEIH